MKLETELIPAHEKKSRRLMVVLHGLGDSMEGYRWLPENLNLPWLNYLLVNAPDQYYGGYSWYDFAGDQAAGVRRSRKLLCDLLAEQGQLGFPPEKTILFGFSQGCLMVIEVGLRHSHRFAGLVGVSGYVFEPEQLVAELEPVALQQRLLITHGTLDPLIPIAKVREQIKQLQAAKLGIVWREFPKAHTIAGETELNIIRAFVNDGFGQK